MKKLLLILVFCLTLFSQVSYKTAVIDSGATVSDTVSISPMGYVVGLITPAGLTDSLTLNVGYLQGGALYPLFTADSSEYVVLVDSAKETAIISYYEDLQAFRYFSFTSKDEADTTKNITILYKEE